jgi:SAM-dependent methyltransferase
MSGFTNPAEFANIAKSEQCFWWCRGMRSILFRMLDPFLASRRVGRAVQGDIRALPFADGAFDLVLSVDVLPHLPRGQEQFAARELARVLAHGGLLVVRRPRSPVGLVPGPHR